MSRRFYGHDDTTFLGVFNYLYLLQWEKTLEYRVQPSTGYLCEIVRNFSGAQSITNDSAMLSVVISTSQAAVLRVTHALKFEKWRLSVT
jgi:hypothetical protein